MKLIENTFYICKQCGSINYSYGYSNHYAMGNCHCQKCNKTQNAQVIDSLTEKILVKDSWEILSEPIKNFGKFELIFQKSDKTYDFKEAAKTFEKMKDAEELTNSQICEILEKHNKTRQKNITTYRFDFDNSRDYFERKINVYKNERKLVRIETKLKQILSMYQLSNIVAQEYIQYIKYGNEYTDYYVYNCLKNVFDHPHKEILFKAGYGKLDSGDYRFIQRKTTPHEILGVNKDKAKFLRTILNHNDDPDIKFYFDYASFTDYWDLFRKSENIDLQILKKYLLMIRENGKKVNYSTGNNDLHGFNYSHMNNLPTLSQIIKLLKIAKEHNIKTDILFEYLTNEVREKQGIASMKFAFNAYIDLFNLIDDLKVDYEKYPLSLIQAHDKLAYLRVVKADEINKIKFQEQVDKLKKYEYSNNKYTIITPNEMNDMKLEGDGLNNCVATYIERYRDGYTKVFFMRKNEELNKPYIAVEINCDNRLVQERGYNNRYPEEHERAFVREWLQYIKDVDDGKINKDIKQVEFNCAV